MSDIQHIPLNKLSLSSANVRRTDRRADIDALAASIAAHGLLQNLTIAVLEDGCFAVVAGARRLTALNLLAKKGVLAKDCAIPCHIVSADAAAETSLAENVERVAMNVMDEVEAFASLVDSGLGSEDVARRFGCTLRHVEQRLALARLSPKICAAYRKGDVNLDVARAFCITDDHRAQERVFRQSAKPITHAHSVRQALTQGRVPADHKLAKFVGLETYEAAGGRLVRDLFEDGIAFLDDGALVQRLAGECADSLRDQLLTEGWGWAEAQFGHGHLDGCASERLHATQRRLTPKAKNKIAALEAVIEALDAKLEDADADNPLCAERDAAEATLAAMRETNLVWDRALMAHAGALITIDHHGRPIVTRGLIKRSDFKTLDKLRARSAITREDSEVSDDGRASAETESGPRLTKTLAQRLTSARTRGLRCALAANPHVALALAVHVLIRRSASRAAVSGVGVDARPVGFDDDDFFERARIACAETAPEDDIALLAACLDRPIAALLDALAVLLAETLDFTHDGVTGQDKRVQQMSDALAAALDLDMTRHWEPDQDFFEKAPKTMTIAALDAAPSIAKLGDKERHAMRAAFAKMKKADLARTAAETLRTSGWLPDLLITPARAGAFAVTADGERAPADLA